MQPDAPYTVRSCPPTPSTARRLEAFLRLFPRRSPPTPGKLLHPFLKRRHMRHRRAHHTQKLTHHPVILFHPRRQPLHISLQSRALLLQSPHPPRHPQQLLRDLRPDPGRLPWRWLRWRHHGRSPPEKLLDYPADRPTHTFPRLTGILLHLPVSLLSKPHRYRLLLSHSFSPSLFRPHYAVTVPSVITPRTRFCRHSAVTSHHP